MDQQSCILFYFSHEMHADDYMISFTSTKVDDAFHLVRWWGFRANFGEEIIVNKGLDFTALLEIAWIYVFEQHNVSLPLTLWSSHWNRNPLTYASFTVYMCVHLCPWQT